MLLIHFSHVTQLVYESNIVLLQNLRFIYFCVRSIKFWDIAVTMLSSSKIIYIHVRAYSVTRGRLCVTRTCSLCGVCSMQCNQGCALCSVSSECALCSVSSECALCNVSIECALCSVSSEFALCSVTSRWASAPYAVYTKCTCSVTNIYTQCNEQVHAA